jgi:hypothetical protein
VVSPVWNFQIPAGETTNGRSFINFNDRIMYHGSFRSAQSVLVREKLLYLLEFVLWSYGQKGVILHTGCKSEEYVGLKSTYIWNFEDVPLSAGL